MVPDTTSCFAASSSDGFGLAVFNREKFQEHGTGDIGKQIRRTEMKGKSWARMCEGNDCGMEIIKISAVGG